MIIDKNTPVIVAFILERQSLLHAQRVPNDATKELSLILKFIDGLVEQNKIVNAALETGIIRTGLKKRHE